jgi:hypothetical protein
MIGLAMPPLRAVDKVLVRVISLVHSLMFLKICSVILWVAVKAVGVVGRLKDLIFVII